MDAETIAAFCRHLAIMLRAFHEARDAMPMSFARTQMDADVARLEAVQAGALAALQRAL